MAFTSLTPKQLKQWAEKITDSAYKTGFPQVLEFLTSSGQGALALQAQSLNQQVIKVFN